MDERSPLLAEPSKNGADEVLISKEDEPQDVVLRSWVRQTGLFVYCSHFLSAWGDRMWSFGVGLFLIEIAPESLQLTATYGLCRGGAVLLFGALVGDWVDKNPRLKAARVTLVSQNVFVILGALVVCLLMAYQNQIVQYWDGWLTTLCHSLLILFAVLAQLASVGNTISIERDWIIEICGRDSDRLTKMTATMRRIDLTTAIIAPAVTGQIIGFGSLVYGAAFIGSWNLVSVFVEYILIKKVYDSVPSLAYKKHRAMASTEIDFGETEGEVTIVLESREPPPDACCYVLCGRLIAVLKGWKVYMSYPVAWAGIGLACLYMTVLGFDNITTGYAYSQGMSESFLGVMMGLGGIVGIVGTFAFPLIKNKVGLVRTGLFSMAAEVLCLIMCVVSVWAPGSPFDPFYLSQDGDSTISPTNQTRRNTDWLTHVSGTENYWLMDNNVSSMTTDADRFDTTLLDITTPFTNSSTPSVSDGKSFLSLGLLLAGIITARFGLWISDLTISQQILETVDEKERGIFAGVQTSINMFMDLIKFAMVVVSPDPELFGVLVLISFGFILLGSLSYAFYSRKIRHHILPFHSLLLADERFSKRMPATA